MKFLLFHVLTCAFHLLCLCLVHSRRERLSIPFSFFMWSFIHSITTHLVIFHSRLCARGTDDELLCWMQSQGVHNVELASQSGQESLNKEAPSWDLKTNRMSQDQHVEIQIRDHLVRGESHSSEKSHETWTERREEQGIGLHGRQGLTKQNVQCMSRVFGCEIKNDKKPFAVDGD